MPRINSAGSRKGIIRILLEGLAEMVYEGAKKALKWAFKKKA